MSGQSTCRAGLEHTVNKPTGPTESQQAAVVEKKRDFLKEETSSGSKLPIKVS